MILFVDDSRNIREFCRRELEKAGYEVLAVPTGEDALAACRTGKPDVVVLDIDLPGMDGIETAGRIAAEGLGIPVIFYTAYADRVTNDLRSWAGMACVEKSETLTELKAAVARALAGRNETVPHRRGRGLRSGLAGRRETL
jgi:two-component system response regulator (stage 0 sporulation protein F)